MYTLIGYPQTRTVRVLWMLEELGESYELNPAKPRSEEVRRYNPTGKVPVLLVDGTPIIDSVAIVQYLADRHGKFTAPAGSLDRARQDSWTQFAMDDIELPLWVSAKHTFILPEELRSETAREACKFEFAAALKALETRLGDNTYVMGEEFAVPDLLLGHCANWAENGANWEIPAGPAKAYFDRVRDRPALLRAQEVRDRYS